VLILRLTALAVLVDALAMAALDFLWGCGRVKQLLMSYVSISVILLVSGLVLLNRTGITGVAWALVLSSSAGSVILIRAACAVCGEQPAALLRKSMRGLLAPALGCAAATWGLLQLGNGSWATLLAACAAGTVAYGVLLFAVGARAHERTFVRDMLRVLASRGGA
jgi:hypothetical protein